MANELTLSATLQLEDDTGSNESLQVAELMADVATERFIRHKQSIGTSEEAISLGDAAAPGWAIFINRDATNFINLKVGTAGAIFAKLLPGEFCVLRLGSGAQVPYAIADTAACLMDYLIVNT